MIRLWTFFIFINWGSTSFASQPSFYACLGLKETDKAREAIHRLRINIMTEYNLDDSLINFYILGYEGWELSPQQLKGLDLLVSETGLNFREVFLRGWKDLKGIKGLQTIIRSNDHRRIRAKTSYISKKIGSKAPKPPPGTLAAKKLREQSPPLRTFSATQPELIEPHMSTNETTMTTHKPSIYQNYDLSADFFHSYFNGDLSIIPTSKQLAGIDQILATKEKTLVELAGLTQEQRRSIKGLREAFKKKDHRKVRQIMIAKRQAEIDAKLIEQKKLAAQVERRRAVETTSSPLKPKKSKPKPRNSEGIKKSQERQAEIAKKRQERKRRNAIRKKKEAEAQREAERVKQEQEAFKAKEAKEIAAKKKAIETQIRRRQLAKKRRAEKAALEAQKAKVRKASLISANKGLENTTRSYPRLATGHAGKGDIIIDNNILIGVMDYILYDEVSLGFRLDSLKKALRKGHPDQIELDRLYLPRTVMQESGRVPFKARRLKAPVYNPSKPEHRKLMQALIDAKVGVEAPIYDTYKGRINNDQKIVFQALMNEASEGEVTQFLTGDKNIFMNLCKISDDCEYDTLRRLQNAGTPDEKWIYGTLSKDYRKGFRVTIQGRTIEVLPAVYLK